MPSLVDVLPSSVETLACCGIKDPAHAGRCNKQRWILEQFGRGLRAKVLLTEEGRQCGYLEYIPGEFAWRGVDAAGYLVIHCIWTYFRKIQHQGLGAMMLARCVDDAAAAGMRGVAVVARKGPWLAGPALFLANGFEVVDEAPPDYQLLVKKLDEGAANPLFRRGWEERLKKVRRGLTIIECHQCPHSEKFAGDIVRIAEEEFGLKARRVVVRSCEEAQAGVTPYGGFALIRDGKVIADHPISGTRFRNLMRKGF